MGKEIEETIVTILKKTISPSTIYIFGSYVKGNMRSDSDIDIAFLSKKGIDDYERFMLAQEIADKLGRNVDLIDLNKASTVFQAQIVGIGKTIYCINPLKRMNFEMVALKMYAKLNEERKEIIDRIKESGEVYET
ncbi:type VII toxin-antitoxin system MntA family adenylyltransferase antitoxin [Anaerobacillus alkaliphilus]|uniref:type VII toxin-antitoxin system MntA family adenylyltransferase antitoxin n=1 Tax=Anaerobacillus alkaliphilus TaxID=1548597 RepID=UPI0019D64E68|nr:nucleotidyltransferase domain-containing protein [Anaerobacillus alkaliphilus]